MFPTRKDSELPGELPESTLVQVPPPETWVEEEMAGSAWHALGAARPWARPRPAA